MKKLLISYLLLTLTQSLGFAQKTGFSISDNGDFFQNGNKIGKVVKTTNANILTGTISEFTVYDVNGVARFLFEKDQGKLIFLDDNKSFLPRLVDAYAKQIAQFFASDSILTPKGYNVAYRAAFIKKHKGYDFTEKKERDYNAPVKYIENNILQGDALIGRYEYRLMENGKDALVAVYDLNNKKVAFVTTTKDNSVAYFDMKILDANQKEVKVFEKEFDGGQLYKKGIAWVVQNGYLGSSPVAAKSVLTTQATQVEIIRRDSTPLPQAKMRTRLLAVKESEQIVKPPFMTNLGVSVNTNLTRMSITFNESYLEGKLNDPKFNLIVRSRIIDLSAGKLIESIDSSAVLFQNGYTFTTNMSNSGRKFLKNEEINGPSCIKSDLTGTTTCFKKPPVGIIYSAALSENTILGVKTQYDGKTECFIYENVGEETKIKYSLKIQAPKFADDGKTIYGVYFFTSGLHKEYDSLKSSKFNETEPSDKKSKEYKLYKKRLSEFELSRSRRLSQILFDPAFSKENNFNWGIRVYNAKTGQLISDIKLHEKLLPGTNPQNLHVEMLTDGRFLVKYIFGEFLKEKGRAIIYNADFSKMLIIDEVNDSRFCPMFISNKTNTTLSISSDGIFKVFDISTGRIVAHVNDGASGKTVTMGNVPIYLPINEGYVLTPYSNGLVSLFSFKEMKIVADLFVTKDDWVILARDGRFDGSLRALDKLEWREYIGDKLSSRTDVASTFDGYYTPRLFNQLLTGEIGKLIAPVLSKQTAESLPKLTVTAIDNQSPSQPGNGIINFSTSKKNIVVDLKITDNGKKVKEVRIYNNGKLVGVQSGNSTDNFKFNISLNSVMGEINAVYAVATTELGVDSEKAKMAFAYTGSDSQPPKMYALIIGVNEYQNPKYKLNYAYSDAQGFQKQVVKLKSELFEEVVVSTLFDKQANKTNVFEAFRNISTNIKEQDVFVFYFAGHGTMGNVDGKEEFFLVPYDVTQLYGNNASLQEKAISAGELKHLSSQLNAQKQIFILDACNSAGALNAAATRGIAEEKAVAQLARSTGSYWLTAAGSEQYATELAQLGHGVFTYSLLEALSGRAVNLAGDGILTIRELSSFVEKRVPELSQEYKGAPQYPSSFSIGNDFPLLIFTKEK